MPVSPRRYGGFSLGAGSSQALPSAAEVDEAVLELRALFNITPVRPGLCPPPPRLGSSIPVLGGLWPKPTPHPVFPHPGQPLRPAPGQPQPLHRGLGRSQEHQGMPDPGAGGPTGVRARSQQGMRHPGPHPGLEQLEKD